MSSPSLSIIVPTLNEADHLQALLTDLKSQEGVVLEVAIADGGSTDQTESIANSWGAAFVPARRGRATQMNAAALKCGGDFLLFLHADSRLPDPCLLKNALSAAQQKIRELDHDRVAGHFPLHFVRSSSRHTMAYRYMEEKTAFNRVNTTNGDQGFLMPRTYFKELGGYDENLPFLEDQELAERIRREGLWITLPGVLHTSARRFEKEGFHRRYILMGIVMGLYSTGVMSFFHRAPHVYRAQADTAKLRLTPFFSIIWRIMREELGLMDSFRAWFRVGRYVRQNAWQLFYFFDIWLRPRHGPGHYPCLTLHDRVIGPLLDFRVFDAATALLAFIWYMGILAPYFWIREYPPMASGEKEHESQRPLPGPGERKR
jgi:rSAM/selenodomain-associated transferase 2